MRFTHCFFEQLISLGNSIREEITEVDKQYTQRLLVVCLLKIQLNQCYQELEKLSQLK